MGSEWESYTMILVNMEIDYGVWKGKLYNDIGLYGNRLWGL